VSPPSGWLAEPPDDPCLVQVVWRHFHLHPVARGDADPALAHLSANRCQHYVFVGELDAKHGAREDHGDDAFNLDVLFLNLIIPAFVRSLIHSSFGKVRSLLGAFASADILEARLSEMEKSEAWFYPNLAPEFLRNINNGCGIRRRRHRRRNRDDHHRHRRRIHRHHRCRHALRGVWRC
jgi:hypothetical protein